jgi:hypothetical protein
MLSVCPAACFADAAPPFGATCVVKPPAEVEAGWPDHDRPAPGCKKLMDYLPLLLFAAFMVGTPGPANMLLMTSGANFGLVRSLPFLAGVTMGKVLLNLLLALGLWRLLVAQPEVLAALKVVCIAYLAGWRCECQDS